MIKLSKSNYMFCLKSYSSFFHNSRLIRWIQQNKIYKKFRDLIRNWTQVTCLTVRHLNHYTKLVSVPVWGYNWILFMLKWFCPVRLIHIIGRKSFHFEKARSFSGGGGKSTYSCYQLTVEDPIVIVVLQFAANFIQIKGPFRLALTSEISDPLLVKGLILF